MTKKAMIVDLNNYARYPTMAIAYLVTPLRKAGYVVEVKSPLAVGAPPFEHERRETRREHALRRINLGTRPLMQRLHEPLREQYGRFQMRAHRPTIEAIPRWLDSDEPDVLLLSAYLQHHEVVAEIARQAGARGIPVLLGGPAFASDETVASWIELDGITAIMAGEADLTITDLVDAAIAGDDLDRWPGVTAQVPSRRAALTVNGGATTVAEPLQDLDRLPIPDYDDFPWDAYPHRIVPVMTGRGCGWGRCTFCSDVTTANGRTYRSRSLDAVLGEIRHQAERYASTDFIFLDLKLNSDLDVWYGLIENFQSIVPGARWIATVHVDGTGENGLSAETLQAAADAGLRRISFGLETASQTLARRMSKGTKVERNQQFVQDAAAAGLSVRTTMIIGYPGETADDLRVTGRFLDHNIDNLDRVRPARFKAIPGTRFEQQYNHRPSRFGELGELDWDHRYGRATYRYGPAVDPAYRSAKRQVLRTIHRINRKPLRDGAEQFDGLM